jgi:hypothetical protein
MKRREGTQETFRQQSAERTDRMGGVTVRGVIVKCVAALGFVSDPVFVVGVVKAMLLCIRKGV